MTSPRWHQRSFFLYVNTANGNGFLEASRTQVSVVYGSLGGQDSILAGGQRGCRDLAP